MPTLIKSYVFYSPNLALDDARKSLDLTLLTIFEIDSRFILSVDGKPIGDYNNRATALRHFNEIIEDTP